MLTAGEFNGVLYLTTGDGGAQNRPTPDDDAWDSFPAWSPDGTQIAFSSHRDGRRDVYVIDADGSDLVRLTNDSRDGGEVAAIR